MSRTKRKIRKWEKDQDTTIITEGDDTQAKSNKGWWGHRKMTPYTRKPNETKYKASKTCHVPGTAKGVSAYDKLTTKNANRSKKKAYRQQLKKELKYELRQYI